MGVEENLGRANVAIRATLDKLDGDLAGAKSKIGSAVEGIAQGVNNSLKIIGTGALAGIGAATAAIGGLVAFLGNCTREAMAAQEVEAQLDAVLKSTGAAADAQAQAWADAQGKYATAGAKSAEEIAKIQAELTKATAKLHDMGTAWDKNKNKTESGALALQEAKDRVAQLQAELAGAPGKVIPLTQALGLTAPAARMVKDEILNLADSLSTVTRFEDDVILSGENMLLTFTSIGKDVFPLATQTMLDMSQALGSDVKNSAMMLGKALNDPIAGVTALRRVGVRFTDAQQAMIDKMVKAGDVAGAQKMILAELQTEFGGSARAAGETFAGQLDILKNRLGNVKESIGGALIPILTRLMGTFVPLIDKVLPPLVGWFEKSSTAVAFLLDQISGWGIDKLFTTFEDGSSILQGFFEKLGFGSEIAAALAEPLNRIGSAFIYLRDMIAGWGIDQLFSMFEDGSSILQGFFEKLGFGSEQAASLALMINNLINTVVPWIEMVWAWIAQNVSLNDVLIALGVAIAAVVIPAIWAIIAAAAPVVATFVGLIAVIALLRQAWETDWGGIRTALTEFWTNTALPALQALWTWLQVNIPLAIATLQAWWTDTLLPALQAFWAWVQGTVFPLLGQLWNWLAVNVPQAIATLKSFWEDTLLPALKTFWAWIEGTVFPLLQTLWDWLAVNVPAAIATLKSFWEDTLLPALKTFWAWIEGTVFPLLQTLWDWLSVNVPAAIDTLKAFWMETLLPALQEVWAWVDTNLIPLFEAIGELFDVTLTLAITAMAGLWEKTLQPALEAVWKFMDESVLPVLQAIADKVSITLTPVLETLSGFLSTTWKGAWTGISGAIKGVIGWINDLIEKLKNVKLPDWCNPGSPTPFEIGLLGIGEAMKGLATMRVPQFSTELRQMYNVEALPGGEAGNGGRAQVIIYGLTLNGVQDARGLLDELQGLA